MPEKYEIEKRALQGSVEQYKGMDLLYVTQNREERIWDQMMRDYHYLGYQKMIGARVKYLIVYQDVVLGAISYNRAAKHVQARDEKIGWDKKQQEELLKHVVNNNRFLILPWIQIQNLASYILSRSIKAVKRDWQEKYGEEVYLAETFVGEGYAGTCYRAANWEYVGQTKGYGKVGNAFTYHGKRKGVYLYEVKKGMIQSIRKSQPRQTLEKRRWEIPIMMLQKMQWSANILQESGITPNNVEDLDQALIEYLDTYVDGFSRAAHYEHTARYLKGLLSDLERKSIEPMALAYGEKTSVRPMQLFLQEGTWSEEIIHQIYKKKLAGNISEPEGMHMLDGTDFRKKGKESVGVLRQYCGAVGKTENCQASVMLGYSGSRGYGLVDKQLYLPQKWFEAEYADRRKKCKIPEEITFQTKIQIASEMLKKVVEEGEFQGKWVGVDSTFGSSKEFLDTLPEGLRYFADIRSDTLVFEQMPKVSQPAYKGKGRRDLAEQADQEPIRVKELVEKSEHPWETVLLGNGAKGPVICQEKCFLVVEVRKKLPGKKVWLYVRRLEDGSIKYSLCNAPEDASKEEIRRLALMRWPIEQCFRECKDELGMDHYEARSWTAWHRHILLVFVAHLFLLEIRYKFKKKILRPS